MSLRNVSMANVIMAIMAVTIMASAKAPASIIMQCK